MVMQSTRKCLVCAGVLDDAPCSHCAVCQVPLHSACALYQGHCPVYGCGGTVFFVPLDEAFSKQAGTAADDLLAHQSWTLALQFVPTLVGLSLLAKWIPNLLIAQLGYAIGLIVLSLRAAFFSGRRIDIDPDAKLVEETFYVVGFRTHWKRVNRISDSTFIYLVETSIGLRPVLVFGAEGRHEASGSARLVPLGGITGPMGHYAGPIWNGLERLSQEYSLPIVSQENDWVRDRAIWKRSSALQDRSSNSTGSLTQPTKSPPRQCSGESIAPE